MAVDGAYRLIFNYPFARMKITLDLATAGSNLTGTIDGGVGPAPLEQGKVEGNKVSFAVPRTPFPFTVTATIEGDTIKGEADLGIFGKEWMRGSRIDAAGKSSVDNEPAIPWKDLGLPRYEFASVEWVKALGEWLKPRFEGKNLDFEFTWSSELSNPPKHLLRGDGRDTIGWHFIVKDGAFKFGDGPLDGPVDFGGKPVPYDAIAARTRMHTDQMLEWVLKNRPPVTAADAKLPTDANPEMMLKNKRLNDFIAGPENSIRQEFFSQRTL